MTLWTGTSPSCILPGGALDLYAAPMGFVGMLLNPNWFLMNPFPEDHSEPFASQALPVNPNKPYIPQKQSPGVLLLVCWETTPLLQHS